MNVSLTPEPEWHEKVMAHQRLIFSLGTNNWQSAEEYAPGSGILHAQHHKTFNAMTGVSCYSVFPSRRQKLQRADVRVFELEHDIPICESVSPVSSYRWHSMSEQEFHSYKDRLYQFVSSYIEDIEREHNRSLDLMIAHHAFLNPLIMANINKKRIAMGKRKVPLFAFVHGTSLLMFQHEMEGTNPEYPRRFYPRWRQQGVFDHVDGVFVISKSQKERFLSVFDNYDERRIFVTPNGIDPKVFFTNSKLNRDEVLTRFATKPYDTSSVPPQNIPPGYDKIVLFVGKLADIKRLDCLLKAAVTYEKNAQQRDFSVATVVAGGGPIKDQKLYQELASSLGLSHVYFIGPQQQADLALLYNVADLGVFPTKFEAFGLVFLECMACGTPVVGTAAGGPTEFVDPSVGELVYDWPNQSKFEEALGETINRALVEDWKSHKGQAAAKKAENYTLAAQCNRMLDAVNCVRNENLGIRIL